MYSPDTIKGLEVILSSAMIAATVVATVSTVVCTFVFLLTRERAHQPVAAGVPATPATRAKRTRELQPAIAG